MSLNANFGLVDIINNLKKEIQKITGLKTTDDGLNQSNPCATIEVISAEKDFEKRTQAGYSFNYLLNIKMIYDSKESMIKPLAKMEKLIRELNYRRGVDFFQDIDFERAENDFIITLSYQVNIKY